MSNQQMSKDLSSLKKIKSLTNRKEVLETPAKSSLGKQKTLQTVMQLSFSLLSMFLSGKIRKLDFTNKDILNASRAGFVGYLAFCYALNALLVYKIKKIGDKSILPRKVDPMAAMMNLMLNKPVKARQSVMDYDLEEASKMLKSLIFEVGVIAVVHGLLKYNSPILLFPLMQLSSKLQNPLVQIHLLGFKAVETLQRPFQNGFERFLSSIQPAEDSNKSADTKASAVETSNEVNSKDDSESNANAAESEDELSLDDDATDKIQVESVVDQAAQADSGTSCNSGGRVVDESSLDEEDEDEEEESVH